uniref:BTB domain-containing protein n=1 Tax=Globodera rostochiensis TaxID=31243 RepID=A0A914H9A7_GLORO
MPTFLFLVAICLLVAASILLEMGQKKLRLTKIYMQWDHPVLAMLNQKQAMFRFDEENAKSAAAATAFSEEIKPVEVPDVEVDAFKAMLAFIYADDLSGLNGDNAIFVFYAANKYNLSELVNSCLNFIWKLNVFFAFDEARFFGKKKLLCEILDRDKLIINEELTIWNTALRWADEQCRQNGIKMA